MEEQISPTSLSDEFGPRSATALRELQVRAQAALAARRERMSHLERQISDRLDMLSATLAEESQSEAKAVEETTKRHAELERLQAELSAQAARQQEFDVEAAKLEDVRRSLEERESKLDAEARKLNQQAEDLSRRECELEQRADELANREQAIESFRLQQDAEQKAAAERESSWKSERSVLDAERDELARKLDDVRAQLRSSGDEWKARLADIEQKLRNEQAAWERQRSELEAARAGVEADRDKLDQELADTKEKLRSAGEDAAAERDELKQKCDLALADMQRFRARVSELEQELARRPEAGGADSAEMVHLRSERDALAARVEELERQSPPADIDADSAQQLADLQRRFEMAVEDVRELKTKNSELESQLVKARKGGASSGDGGGGSDWESLKRRMLASLEGEGDDVEPARQKERETIQNTIEITDAVVAEKDRELEELRSQLAARGNEPVDAEDKRDEEIQKLVDADEIIAQHRERASGLEKQLEEQLRAAELELSVERAKIAREKAEIEEWRLELETFRKAREAGEPQSQGNAPRRRWLSKLGLHGDDVTT